MNVFIVHQGKEYNYGLILKDILKEKTNSDVLMLDKDDTKSIKNFLLNKKGLWKAEAKKKIKNSQLILVLITNSIKDNENVRWEVEIAKRNYKQIYCLNLENYREFKSLVEEYVRIKNEDKVEDNSKEIIKEFLRKDEMIKESLKWQELPYYLKEKDKYTNEVKIHSLASIIKNVNALTSLINDYINGEYHILNSNTEFTKEDIFRQYELYLETSESVVARRQSVSNFYITVNATMITILSVVTSFAENNQVKVFIMFIMSIVGIILDVSWIKILDNYCILNQSKLKLIKSIEKLLPVSLYDKEWEIMSNKMNSRRYISFTNSEKNIPKIFFIIFLVMLISSVIYFLVYYKTIF